MMTPIHITGLYTYPIKSCGRLEHERIALEARGLWFDRRWMIVDENGEFLTQRELPPLAIIQPSLSDDALTIMLPDGESVTLPLAIPADAPTHPVVVWRDTCIAHDEGAFVAAFLSEFLDHPVRLVRIADAFYRRVDPSYSPESAQTGFADGFPLLLASESSLDELNVRIQMRGKQPVPMTRFRPNLVIGGSAPFVEDHWHQFQVGGIAFDVVKPCARCATTTVDQATGKIPDPQEPLGTLATFRRADGGKVMFAQNVVHRGTGELAVGDMVEIVTL
jgi:hypothetical protein